MTADKTRAHRKREATLEAEIDRLQQALSECREKTSAAPARTKETRLSAIFSNAPTGLSEIGLDGRFLRVNDALCTILGRSRQALLAAGVEDVTHKDDIAPSLVAFKRAIETGGPVSIDKRYERPDGTLVWASSSLTRLDDAAGRPRAVLAVTADLTARKQGEDVLRSSEARQTFLLGLGDALRPLDEPFAVQAMAARLLAEHFGVERAYYVEFDDAAGTMTVHRDYTRSGAPSVAGTHPESDVPMLARMLRSGERFVMSDVQTTTLIPPEERARFEAIDLRASAAVPIVKNGRPVGLLAVAHDTPRSWTDDEIALIADVAERTWDAVQRARTEAALRASEEKYRTLFEAMDEGFHLSKVIFDEAGKPADILFIDANPAALRMVGQDIRGARLTEVYPESEFYWLEIFGRTARTGEAQRLVRHADYGDRWYDFYVFKPDDTADRVATLFQDITDRKQAENALVTSEERFRQFAENSANVLWIGEASEDAPTLEYLSPAYESIWGEPRDRIMSDGARFMELIHPEDRARVSAVRRRLLAGDAGVAEYRIVRSKGDVRWIHDTCFPVRDEAGRIVRVAGIAQDLTARMRAEVRLRESEERLRALVEGIPQLVWRAVDGGEWTWASPQWTDYTGLSELASRGRGWLGAVHPDDRNRTRAVWAKAEASHSFDLEYRIFHKRENRHRWFRTRALPLHDDHGHVIEWFGTSTDIDDLRRLQEEQKVILAELQHRSRNLLAVVRSIAERTLPPCAELDEFGGRLAALSRVQAFLARSEGFAIDLGEIVRSEIQAHGDGDHVDIEGPKVELPGEKAQPFALAVHELATNAVKYGALSSETAHLRIEWRLETDEGGRGRQLVLEWTESGVASPKAEAGKRPKAPSRQGYGRELIERALPYQLDAETRFELTADGVHCSIKVPLART